MAPNVHFARNTLTQRTFGPISSVVVTIDASYLKDGDFAGLGALIGTYGLIAVTKENGRLALVMLCNDAAPNERGFRITADPAGEYGRVPLSDPVVTVKVTCHFADTPDGEADKILRTGLAGLPDYADFSYADRGEWKTLGKRHPLVYRLDYFMGCRFGLFLYSTRQPGGYADFMNFKYEKRPEQEVPHETLE